MNLEKKIMLTIKKNELSKRMFNSFEEAEKSGLDYSFVLQSDEEGGTDLYLTGSVHGLFGEYASWNEDELEEDEELIEDVVGGIKTILDSKHPQQTIKDNGMDFTPYL